MPTALDNGSQNTEKPYAMPMHRWIANAAGGTSQRLKPGLAIMRSLDKNAGCAGEPPNAVLVLIVVSPDKEAHKVLVLAFHPQPPCAQATAVLSAENPET
jgi:hypothetical protein